MYLVTGYADRVRCFKCGLQSENWNKDDIPYNEHRRKNPKCEFLKDIRLQLDRRHEVGNYIIYNQSFFQGLSQVSRNFFRKRFG